MNKYENKKSALSDRIQIEFWNIFEYAAELIIADLKAIGIGISLGIDI